MSNTLKFNAGQQSAVDGTVDIKKMSRSKQSEWRFEQVKAIIRSKPSGFHFTNKYFRDRLGFTHDNSFYMFKNTERFKKQFELVEVTGTHRFELYIRNDVKTTKVTVPTYKKPTKKTWDDSESVECEDTKGAPEPKTSASDEFLELAKRVAIEKLARELTVGEVLDGAKKFNI